MECSQLRIATVNKEEVPAHKCEPSYFRFAEFPWLWAKH